MKDGKQTAKQRDTQSQLQVIARTPVPSSPISSNAPVERSSEYSDEQPGHSSATVAVTLLPLAVLVTVSDLPQYDDAYSSDWSATILAESLCMVPQAPDPPSWSGRGGEGGGGWNRR